MLVSPDPDAPTGIENGRAYDALCVQCSAKLVRRLGAWYCPTHRDLAQARFVERPDWKPA